MLLGWLGTLLLGISAEPSSASETTMRLQSLGITMLDFVFLGTLTFFGAVITRSTIGAVIIGLLVPVILRVLQQVLPLLIAGSAIVLPSAHIQNLRDHWGSQGMQILTTMTPVFNGSVSPVLSLLIMLVYIALLVGAGLVVFQRRDLAGE
jgi:ABC-type transport system involved in multi-copper enzyme maturation permease subunit